MSKEIYQIDDVVKEVSYTTLDQEHLVSPAYPWRPVPMIALHSDSDPQMKDCTDHYKLVNAGITIWLTKIITSKLELMTRRGSFEECCACNGQCDHAGPGSSLQVRFEYYICVYYSVVYRRIIASELDFMTQRGKIEECLRAIAMRGPNLSHPPNQPTCLPASARYI